MKIILPRKEVFWRLLSHPWDIPRFIWMLNHLTEDEEKLLKKIGTIK